MLCLPKSSCVEILTPTGDGIIRRFGLWGCLGHEDGALMVEVSALTKEAPESSLAPSTR